MHSVMASSFISSNFCFINVSLFKDKETDEKRHKEADETSNVADKITLA